MSSASTLPVDLAEALDRVGDDRELLVELFGLFEDDVPSQIEKLQTATEFGDLNTAGAIAHNVKGAAASLSAHGVRDAAKVIEDACREQQAAGLDAHVANLQTQVQQLLTFIKNFS